MFQPTVEVQDDRIGFQRNPGEGPITTFRKQPVALPGGADSRVVERPLGRIQPVVRLLDFRTGVLLC